jgi:methyl-accepting chemotaxis protein
MPIETGFKVRLGIYGITPQVDALRPQIWDVLAPHIEAVLNAYFDHTGIHAPFYKDRIEQARADLVRRGAIEIKKLLLEPFDEAWVESAYARAKAEIATGQDIRTRGATAIFIVTELNRLIAARHPFSVQKAMRLMSAAMQVFALDAANAVACHKALEIQQGKARADLLDTAIREFGRAADGVRQTVDMAVKSFGATSNQLAQLANDASIQATTAMQAAEDTALKVNSIATATEELSAAVEEMHAQTAASAKMTSDAVVHSQHTSINIRALSEAAEKIGSVVGMISKIAAQTNLLALNATIEAARAGEMGKGFAVVALEVKSLAQQTAKATEDVGRQISLVQEATRKSMGEIASTDKTIMQISAVAEAVATSVSQQASATNEIAHNASGAAANAATVTAALKTVGDTLQRTEETTKLVLSFSADLARRSDEIGQAMDALFAAAATNKEVRALPNLAAARK